MKIKGRCPGGQWRRIFIGLFPPEIWPSRPLRHEAHISAQPPQARQHARLPSSHVHQERPQGACPPPCPGTYAPLDQRLEAQQVSRSGEDQVPVEAFVRLRARFPRRLRLKQRRLLRPLFARGRSPESASAAPGGPVVTAAAGCIRVLARVSPAGALAPGPYPFGVPLQVAFVPGRQPSAVIRNRVRRQLREVYRVHHGRLVGLAPFQALAATGAGLSIALLFRGAVGSDLHMRVSHDLPRALDRLAAALGTSGPPAPTASSHNPPSPLA